MTGTTTEKSLPASDPKAIEFRIGFHIVPKARARVTRRGTYHKTDYAGSKKALSDILAIEWIMNRRILLDPPVRVDVLLGDCQSYQGDGDNILGAICDSLKEAKIIQNDGQKIVRAHSLDRRQGRETIITVREYGAVQD